MSLHLFHSSVIWIQLTHHAIRRGDMNQLQLFPDGSNMHSWYLEVLSCFSLCWKVEIWILLWSISFLCYVLHICKGTWGKSWGRFLLFDIISKTKILSEKLNCKIVNVDYHLFKENRHCCISTCFSLSLFPCICIHKYAESNLVYTL